MNEKKRILFVDDQTDILSGLRRLLHKMQDEWEMEFCDSGKAALEVMEHKTFDLVVSDMMMPEMNGAQFLKRVRELYPGTVRFILSGHSDKELILQSVGYAHQYIAKPCDAETLKQNLNSSSGLRQILANPELHRKIAKVRTLPSLPETYNKIVHEIQSEMASIDVIANLIAKDIGLSAKLLQIVNSAFFGLPQHLESVKQAVNYLGLNTVQSLVLTAGLHNQMQEASIPTALLESIFSHSMAVGTLSKKIASEIGLELPHIEDTLIAGLLHDIGKLVLLANFQDEMNVAIILAREEAILPYEAEKVVLGVDHGEIGAHLLSLWGINDPILEAVAFHHDPLHVSHPKRSILTAVYLANEMCMRKSESEMELRSHLNTEYLEALNLTDELPRLTQFLEAESVEERI